MPWLFTRYQAAASEVPRLNDDNAASAATRDEEHAVSHLKRGSRHHPADRFLEGLKMRSPVVNGFLIPNKRKQYKQKETNQHIQFHFSFSPNKQDACKNKKTMHLLHSHQKRSQTRETWTFGTKNVRSSIRADGGCDSCSSVDHWWVGHLKLEGFGILNAWTYWFVPMGLSSACLDGFPSAEHHQKMEAMSATSSGRVERPCKRNIDGFHEIKWNW